MTNDDFPNNRGKCSGTDHGYKVEARCIGPKPSMVGGQIFDNRWSEVSFEKSKIGVPQAHPMHRHLIQNGLLSYAAAQALRWWLHAVADAEMIASLCVETRLVKHEVTYESSVDAVSVHCVVSGVDRSSQMPDRKEPSHD